LTNGLVDNLGDLIFQLKNLEKSNIIPVNQMFQVLIWEKLRLFEAMVWDKMDISHW
jgi:hypothetical protein